MDYMQFVNYHRQLNSDITIGCIAYDEQRASDFGLMKVNSRAAGCKYRRRWDAQHLSVCPTPAATGVCVL